MPIWNFRLVIGATWADISKAARVLGWRPQVTFEEGIARLVEWYQANRAWASDIEEYLKK